MLENDINYSAIWQHFGILDSDFEAQLLHVYSDIVIAKQWIHYLLSSVFVMIFWPTRNELPNIHPVWIWVRIFILPRFNIVLSYFYFNIGYLSIFHLFSQDLLSIVCINTLTTVVMRLQWSLLNSHYTYPHPGLRLDNTAMQETKFRGPQWKKCVICFDNSCINCNIWTNLWGLNRVFGKTEVYCLLKCEDPQINSGWLDP